MFSKSRLVVVGLLIALAIAPATQTASAAVPDTLITAGTTRYAAVGASTSTSTTSTSWVNLSGMTTNIAIPAGKVGDVFLFFCGEAWTNSFTGGRAVIGTWVSGPVILRETSSSAQSQCVNFFRLGVPAGTWNVRMQWRGLVAGTQQMFNRSMIVMVNIR